MKAVSKLTFEEAAAELDSVVAQMESGDLALEAALKAYERGQALAQHCQTLLTAAEKKVRKLQRCLFGAGTHHHKLHASHSLLQPNHGAQDGVDALPRRQARHRQHQRAGSAKGCARSRARHWCRRRVQRVVNYG